MSKTYYIGYRLISKAVQKAEKYNKTPIKHRKPYFEADFNGPTLILKEGKGEFAATYMLETIPVWAKDFDEVKSAKINNTQKSTLGDPFKASVKCIVDYHDNFTGEYKVMSVEKFTKMIDFMFENS